MSIEVNVQWFGYTTSDTIEGQFKCKTRNAEKLSIKCPVQC